MTDRPAARLFAALELPAAARAALAEWAVGELGGRSELRLIADESLHVTLSFLGWRAESEVGEIGEAVAGCAAPGGALALGAAAWLPPRRPRVLAVDLLDGDGALV